MGSPFRFPQSQPQEDMSGAYSRWMGNIPDNSITSYLDPEDERIKKLRELYAKPSGAEGVVSDYINSMPKREDYNPSIWRKLGGALIGTLERTGYTGARNFIEEPYQNAYKDWGKEGQFIDDRARLLEADKNREIKATEFGLRTANETARRNAGLSSTRNGQVINAAGQDVRNQNADASREQSGRIQEERLGLAREGLGLANERLNLSRERYENPKYKPTAPPDVTDRAREMESGNKITDQAKNDVISHPTFKQYFDIVDDTVTLKPDTPPEIKVSIQKFIEARIKNYKLGLSPDSRGGF